MDGMQRQALNEQENKIAPAITDGVALDPRPLHADVMAVPPASAAVGTVGRLLRWR